MTEWAALVSPDWALLTVLVPVVVLSCFVFVTVGFGGGVVAVPVAALFIDLPTVLPILVVIECYAVFRLLRLSHLRIERSEAIRIVPASALGTIVGVTLLLHLPVRWLMFAMAAFVFTFLASRLFTVSGTTVIARAWAWPAGIVAGICSGAFGAGGPPSVIYLNLRGHGLDTVRATIATTGTANLIFRVAGFLVAGLYANAAVISTALWLLPVAFVTVRLAERWRGLISANGIRMATYAVLGISAISLFLRALWLSGQ